MRVVPVRSGRYSPIDCNQQGSVRTRQGARKNTFGAEGAVRAGLDASDAGLAFFRLR
ncbi:hypothetical protein RSSM_04291 [Rhodopirellula sallentina SM41]|uniref:Uncharacterized protein n=1 Tax=Rhodopirellula sallentina SM41 TaxID=1263870 RepID=M5TYN4_9BACT|nr:hypothetical protein RSSM_04291 [Rhodopirellula sallentina SM41]